MSEKKQTTLYLAHFGLREAPFKITPTTEFFYGGGQRGEILHALLYAINVGEGIMSVTGEVGSGKTMLLRTLMEKLPENVDIIYIANPSLSGREILYNICEELGLQVAETRPNTVRLLQNYLLEQHTKKRRVIAFIDEAQAVPDESLEEIRLLSNLETNRDKLLQIVLFGQPEFEEKLKQQNMRQLRERITVALKLKPFGRDDVREYISTRLRVAGYNGSQLFSNDSCRLIAVVSQGLSRRINVLADKSLLSAYEHSSLKVNYADVRRAIRDVNFGKMRYRSEQSKLISKQLTIGVATAAFLLFILAASVRLYGGGDGATSASKVAVAASEQTAATLTATDIGQPAEAPQATVVFSPTEATAAEVTATETTVAEVTVTEATAAETTAAEGRAVAAVQPPPTIVVQTVVQTVVVQQVAAEEPDRQAMLAAISEINHGEADFSGEQLAAQIAENAEEHTDAPQTQGGDTTWQAVATLTDGIIENERWNWMPASSYLRSRLNATQTWLQTQGDTPAYTARLITVSQQRAVFLEKFLRYFSDFYPIRNAMVYPLRLEHGDKFVVTFGIYSTRTDAEVFISNVPYYFTGGKPFVQQLSASLAEAQRAWGSKQ